jgi:NAD(P)-dependent dehydrogenase (short-subunit alcohol dehydrogenase family)
MQNQPVALVTGANQGIGLQIAKDLVAHGFKVLVGSLMPLWRNRAIFDQFDVHLVDRPR